MRFINQTKLHSKTVKGNCMTACFASYLNLSIDDVPVFEEIENYDYVSDLVYWLQEKGYDIETSYEDPFIEDGFKDYYFACGKSPRSKGIHHLVIYRNDELVHDPHPDKTGLLGKPTSYWYLNKIESC